MVIITRTSPMKNYIFIYFASTHYVILIASSVIIVAVLSISSWPLRMPSDAAAWLTAAKANPLEVKSAPCTSPGENEIDFQNGAVAINPFDWMIQHLGDALFPLPYPSILGFDVAGEVVEVGSSGSRFTLGDRVLGYFEEQQSVRRCFSDIHCPFIPYGIADSKQFILETAVVLPLGMPTAACGLFQLEGSGWKAFKRGWRFRRRGYQPRR